MHPVCYRAEPADRRVKKAWAHFDPSRMSMSFASVAAEAVTCSFRHERHPIVLLIVQSLSSRCGGKLLHPSRRSPARPGLKCLGHRNLAP